MCSYNNLEKYNKKKWVKTCDEPVGPGDYPDSSLSLYVEMMKDTKLQVLQICQQTEERKQ